MADKFPYIEGQPAEIFHDGRWKRGKIVAGYRFRDGIVTIQTEKGERVWCGESRDDLYRPVREIDVMTREEKIKKISQHYGYNAQSRQCIEECAELIQAINKYWRKDLQCGKYPYNPCDGYMPDESEEFLNLIEEIADVEIMLEQMKFFLVDKRDVEQIIDEKLDRQLDRMEEENADKGTE